MMTMIWRVGSLREEGGKKEKWRGIIARTSERIGLDMYIFIEGSRNHKRAY